jgi:hypothetical protein
MNWISTATRMPKHGEQVLFYNSEFREIYLGTYDEKLGCFKDSDGMCQKNGVSDWIDLGSKPPDEQRANVNSWMEVLGEIFIHLSDYKALLRISDEEDADETIHCIEHYENSLRKFIKNNRNPQQNERGS